VGVRDIIARFVEGPSEVDRLAPFDAPPAARAVMRRVVAPETSAAAALFAGAAVGAALVGGASALGRLFGSASPTIVLLAAVLAGALARGAARDVPLPGDAARRGRAALGVRLILLGSASLLGALAGSAGPVMAALGGGLEAGVLRETLARLLVALVVLGPVGLLAGSALRRGLTRLPEGDRAPRLLGAALAAAVFAVVAVRGGALLAREDPARIAGVAGGAALVLAGGLALRRRGADVEDPEPAPEESGGVFPLFAALAVAFTLAASRFLSTRALVPVFGNELPGLRVADVALGAGGVVGVVLAVTLSRRGRSGEILSPVLSAGAAILAISLLERRDPLPAAFQAAIVKAASLDDVIREAFRIAAPRAAPLGLLLGATGGLLATSLPLERARRTAWLARVVAGLGAGAALGIATPRFSLHPLGFETALRASAVVAAALAAVAAASGAFPLARRAALVVGLPALAVIVAGVVPRTDRRSMLVDRGLGSPGSGQGVQKNWVELDEDDDRLSAALLRRGHARRLLVNGRFESSNETTAKTHGILAQLPLSLHPKPKRVLVVGAGTGGALAVAEAYPVDRIDLVDTGPSPVRAAMRMGPTASAAFQDTRVRVRLGDARDLVARGGAYDVILLEPAGAWSGRAAQLSTVEFLRLARARLGEGGLVCLWIPDSALTREGFLVLLATWTSVFPRVEAWAGEGGDVLLLANRDGAPHDFARMLAAYRDPRVAAACRTAWIATPETLLSQFLIGDATVRRIAAGRAPATRGNSALTREEAARRRTAPTVDPVPGLAAIRDDVVATLVGTPGEGFAPAIAIAVRARDLQWKGLDLELAGKLDEAVAAYREAMTLNPHDGSVRRAFASLRSQQGIEYGTRQSFFAAHGFMREAVEADTTYAQGFGNLGLLLAQAEQFDYAIACTGQAMELAPDDDLLQLQMGRIWKQRGYYDKALPYYEKAMQLNPKSVEAAIGFVDARLAMEGDAADLRWGVDFLEKYRALEPDHEDLLYRIGKLNDALSRHATRAGAESTAAAATSPAAASPARAPTDSGRATDG
jgi:tetratricopeptide (TPR) repeat protein